MTEERTKKIQELNDKFRTTFVGGRTMTTPGVKALEPIKFKALLAAVNTYDTFNEDNDPHGEHDFGRILFDGENYFWKIDYYDKKLEFGSEDPSDPEQTTRVLTIMRADEY